MRRSRNLALAVCAVLAATTATAHGQYGDRPYHQTRPLDTSRPNQARLVMPAREHPEVEVSRTLAAQPVHPWMARVHLNNITTFVDPLQRLDKKGRGIDENHSIARAQRLHLQLRGVTTTELNALRNASRDAVDRPTAANRAQAILAPPPQERQAAVPIHIIPRPDRDASPRPGTEPGPADPPRRDTAPQPREGGAQLVHGSD